MSDANPNISVNVDVTNPGQFFACCGLLELADRLWPGAEGWFDSRLFHVDCDGTWHELLTGLHDSHLEPLDPDDQLASAMRLDGYVTMDLDWWRRIQQGKALKVWAGSMSCVRIARAMKHAIPHDGDAEPTGLFDHAVVVYDPEQRTKKVEPFYFDSRRGRNAQSLDIGFAPDGLKLKTVAYPAVELLCLIGLQRCRPRPTTVRRVFEYTTWRHRVPIQVACLVACGALPAMSDRTYSFENGFRTDQRKHKSFLPATPVGAST